MAVLAEGCSVVQQGVSLASDDASHHYLGRRSIRLLFLRLFAGHRRCFNELGPVRRLLYLRSNGVDVRVARRVSAVDARLDDDRVRLSSQYLVFGSFCNGSSRVAEGRQSTSEVVDSIDNALRRLFDMLYLVALPGLKVFL